MTEAISLRSFATRRLALDQRRDDQRRRTGVRFLRLRLRAGSRRRTRCLNAAQLLRHELARRTAPALQLVGGREQEALEVLAPRAPVAARVQVGRADASPSRSRPSGPPARRSRDLAARAALGDRRRSIVSWRRALLERVDHVAVAHVLASACSVPGLRSPRLPAIVARALEEELAAITSLLLEQRRRCRRRRTPAGCSPRTRPSPSPWNGWKSENEEPEPDSATSTPAAMPPRRHAVLRGSRGTGALARGWAAVSLACGRLRGGYAASAAGREARSRDGAAEPELASVPSRAPRRRRLGVGGSRRLRRGGGGSRARRGAPRARAARARAPPPSGRPARARSWAHRAPPAARYASSRCAAARESSAARPPVRSAWRVVSRSS